MEIGKRCSLTSQAVLDAVGVSPERGRGRQLAQLRAVYPGRVIWHADRPLAVVEHAVDARCLRLAKARKIQIFLHFRALPHGRLNA